MIKLKDPTVQVIDTSPEAVQLELSTGHTITVTPDQFEKYFYKLSHVHNGVC